MLFLPDSCVVCGERGRSPCDLCARHLPAPPILPTPQGIDSITALMAYEAEGRKLISALKYCNRRGALAWLSAAMADSVAHIAADSVASGGVGCITWMPASVAGRQRRGFDPACVLARRISWRLDIPARCLLDRDPGPAQSVKDRQERLAGPLLHARRTHVPKRILLIDDVATTGSSLTSAARVLRSHGAEVVHAVVAARTPQHRA